MKREPFVVVNSDALWTEAEGGNLIKEMTDAWDDDKYDIMLMLLPLENSYHTMANGDYDIDAEGYPVRRRSKEVHAAYLYGGVLIVHPRVFDNEPEGRYWLIDIFDRLEKLTVWDIICIRANGFMSERRNRPRLPKIISVRIRCLNN